MAKTFLLGVGCQKGGTTWVHSYLAGHPNADMGFKKEYRVFDSIHQRDTKGTISRPLRRAEGHSRALRRRSGDDVEVLGPAEFFADVENYFTYFRRLAGKDGVQLVGDITPAYAGLPAEIFSDVRRKLERDGFSVRVLFLMRDPVERVWSAARMLQREKMKKDPGHEPKSEDIIVRKRYTSPNFIFQTRYEETIRALEAAFDPATIHYEFYERLMNAQAIRTLTDFLGLPFVAPDFDRRLNVTEKQAELSDEMRRTVAQYYKPTYDFVVERFGRSTVEPLWSNLRFAEPEPAAAG